MTKKFYAVCGVHQHMDLFGFKQKLEMVWADGMAGVLPVFTNKKKAMKYAGKKYQTIKFEEIKPNTGN